MKPVDVIVPIYNAPDHVNACVSSVLAKTEHPGARIILTDDASTDSRIGPLLEGFARDSRVEVIVNESNLGFVANCNQAMAASDRDVVLLNSDTLVPNGWLNRLQDVAYRIDRVGSVTPLSNNAEVCSSPLWFQPNTYPDRVDVDALDSVMADLAEEALIDLPTGVGFCLYLRRSALDVVGLFDEGAFGRGYGEENDLCARMRHSGYLNLLAHNVFVSHVGGSSFSGSGRLDENLEVLATRWPGYHRSVALYKEAQSLRGVNSRIGLEITARERDPEAIRPLFLLHYRTRTGRKGGTEHHTEDLIDGAGKALDPMVLTFEYGRPMAQWDADSAGMSFPAAIDDEDQESNDWIGRILDCGVDLIHVQHPKRFPLATLEDVHRRAADRQLPIVWSLHDYYTTCPCVQLVHSDGSSCPSPTSPCEPCESLARDEQGVTLAEWRLRYRALAGSAAVRITPSRSAAEMQHRLLALDDPPMVIPHGISGRRVTVRPPQRERPRIVVLGYSAPQKGGELARSLVEHTRDEVEWLFLGRDHLEGVRPTRRVRFLGVYERERLPEILEELQPDAIALLSNWEETYLYTLSEAWRSGIPVFGSSVGAMRDRISASGGGVLIDHEDPRAAALTILDAVRDSHTMQQLREQAGMAGRALPTVQEVSGHYLRVYSELVGEARAEAAVDHPRPTEGEWRGWLGSFPVPFPTNSARPLRVGQPVD